MREEEQETEMWINLFPSLVSLFENFDQGRGVYLLIYSLYGFE